jgi:DNA-binding CsgD family transcriptional regulator
VKSIVKETFTDITLYDTSPYVILGIYRLSGSSETNHMVYRFQLSQTDNLLSRKEKEVQALVEQGSSSKEIAERLCLSKHTVDTYRRRIKRKKELCQQSLSPSATGD